MKPKKENIFFVKDIYIKKQQKNLNIYAYNANLRFFFSK